MVKKRKLNPQERKIVSVVGAAHFYSHFYFLVLPLMFPILYEVYGIGYTELGIGYAVFSATTAFLQAPVGFMVDRYGARFILIVAVAVESLVLIAFGIFQTYASYLILMTIAGAANSVYHPCDYSILTRSVERASLGRAFSIHTFCGQMGAVTAPLVVVLITAGLEWHYAIMLCGCLGFAITGCLIWGFKTVQIPPAERDQDSAAPAGRSLRLLLSKPVLLGWLFFMGYAMSSTGLYDFSVSAFTEIYASTLAQAGFVIWLFLITDAIGILSAGALSHRWQRHETVVCVCFVIIAALMFLITFVPMSLIVLSVPMAVAGFFYGFIAPSRDVIIAGLAPAKDMGKVFGTITTGFNAGGIVGPPLFGFLLDSGDPYSIFWGAGVICIATVFTISRTPARGSNAQATRQRHKSA